MAPPSQIETIITLIQQWQFSINDGITTYIVDAQPINQQLAVPASMTLPTRITAPALGKVSMNVTKTSFGIGGDRSIVHTLEDMMLWSPVTQELAPSNAAYALLRYCTAYELMVNQYRHLINTATCQAWIEDGLQFEPGVYEYPRGSKRGYLGVLTTLTVKESINNP
mgnify:CR=1 FL=1